MCKYRRSFIHSIQALAFLCMCQLKKIEGSFTDFVRLDLDRCTDIERMRLVGVA
jgi:hypothetical protein